MLDFDTQRCSRCSVSKLCLPVGLNDLPSDLPEGIVIKRYKLTKGDALFRIGDKFKNFFALKCGSCKTFSLTEDGREQITSFYFGGELIGFDAVASGEYSSTLEALEDSVVCEISYANLLEISNTNPKLQNYIIMLMSQRMNFDHSVHFNTTASERLASFLLNYSVRMRRAFPRQTQHHFSMSRQEIGSYLGLSAETVCRVMRKLQNDNIISCSGKYFMIEDSRSLQKLAC
jgi:CRP/FNR family transcriptional regulator, anaerobic regulatory protein